MMHVKTLAPFHILSHHRWLRDPMHNSCMNSRLPLISTISRTTALSTPVPQSDRHSDVQPVRSHSSQHNPMLGYYWWMRTSSKRWANASKSSYHLDLRVVPVLPLHALLTMQEVGSVLMLHLCQQPRPDDGLAAARSLLCGCLNYSPI